MSERRFEYPEILKKNGLPPPDPETMQGLHDIVDEGVLGATNHVALALPLVARLSNADRTTARDEALELARFIARTRGSNAPIVANALNWQTEGVEFLTTDEAAVVLSSRAEAWGAAASERRRALIAKATQTLSEVRRPLIYDYSSTVADVVRALAGSSGLDIIVIPESRAIDGGRRYMTALADLGSPVSFVPDAAIEYATTRSDVVLLGAESVTCDGAIINTVGSTMAARAACVHGIPVYGAADLFKVGARTAAEVPEPLPRRYDFLLKPGDNASTEAPELEIVPPDLITAILTEVGPVEPQNLATAVLQREASQGSAP